MFDFKGGRAGAALIGAIFGGGGFAGFGFAGGLLLFVGEIGAVGVFVALLGNEVGLGGGLADRAGFACFGSEKSNKFVFSAFSVSLGDSPLGGLDSASSDFWDLNKLIVVCFNFILFRLSFLAKFLSPSTLFFRVTNVASGEPASCPSGFE